MVSEHKCRLITNNFFQLSEQFFCPLCPSISIIKPLERKRRMSVSMSNASHTCVNFSLGFCSTALNSLSESTCSGVDLLSPTWIISSAFHYSLIILLLVLSVVVYTFRLLLRCASNCHDLFNLNMTLIVRRVCMFQ